MVLITIIVPSIMGLIKCGFILKTFILSSGGDGPSVTKDITITNQLINIRNIGTFTQTTNVTKYRPVTEQLRLFHDARTKEMAIFAIDEHDNCQEWADVDKCRQSEYMVIRCTEHGLCEKISCRRSCDIVLLPANEVPCKKKQRREWYDDLREEYLDHSTLSNRLRNEALFKMFFFGKVNDVITEYSDQDMVYSVLDLLSVDERSSLVHEVEDHQETLVAIGEDHVNVYNLMTYYLNIATGMDYKYISLSPTQIIYNKLPDSIILEAMDQFYKDNDEVDVDWYRIWSPHPEERKVSTSKFISKESFELDLRDELLMNKTNVMIDYAFSGIDGDDRSFILSLLEGGLEKEAVLKKGAPNLNLDGEQYTPSDVEAGSSKVTPLKAGKDSVNPLEDEYLLEPPCTRAINQWLEDRREFFISWRDEMDYKYRVEESLELNILPQEPFLFQGYLVGKMIDLVVPTLEKGKVYGETDGTPFTFETLSFPKITDTEKRDRVSAYLLSLLSDEERTKLLYRLDELEGKLLRNTHLNITQLGFDFNNLMEYFLNYYHENVTRQEARRILDFYQKVLVAAYDENGKLGSGMREMYLDMFTQLDDDDERSLLENGTTKVKEILSQLGANEKDYHNWYNVMTYFENIAKGTELEYVSTSVLLQNLDMLERFLPHDYDADETSNSTDDDKEVGVKSSVMLKIESVLTSKPHPDLDDSWKWADLNDTMLFDVCDRIGYGNDLVRLLYKTHMHGMMIRVAKECHIVQALRGVLPDHYEDWIFLRRRDAIEYMVSKVSITYDERSYLRRTYIDAMYPNIQKEKQTVVKETTYFERLFEGMLYIIGLLMCPVITVKLLQLVFPKKKKSRKKPKNAKKKDKTSIYSHLMLFVHHMHTKLLGISSKLCGIIWNLPSLLLAVVLAAYDSVTDALTSTTNVSFEIIQQLFTLICSILSRGMKCLVLIPQMIYVGIGMMIRLPPKLIRDAIGIEHASIDVDQPSNSSPQRSGAPQLAMSPSSAVSTVAVDEQKVNSLVEQNAIRKLEAIYDDSDNNLAEESPLDTAPREEGVPPEIGVNTSQVQTYETIIKASTSSPNDRTSFTLNENDPLLIFLRSQQSCIKGNVDEFYIWLVKYENIESMMALKEAVSDDDYLNDTMRIGDKSYGVKGFKLKAFRCAILEHEDTLPAQQESKEETTNVTMNPPEELVCPISLNLMTNDPVVAADGITYERASIEDWFTKSKAKIREAQGRMKQNPHSEADQRVVDNGVCSPVHGTKVENLVLVPNISLRNMARAYKEEKKKEEVQ